tara:strand:- start:204 stop:503 length:300 start_codon:yes stop_codon:yes gene_type:complete
MTLKRYYVELPMGYVVANSKAEAKEILEQDYTPIHMGGDFPTFTIIPHKDYKISKVSEKITKKDIEQWNDLAEFHNEIIAEIEADIEAEKKKKKRSKKK